MATEADLLVDLKRKSRIQASEGYSDTELKEFMVEALQHHNSSHTYGTLPLEEEEPLLVLAWAKLSLSRASKFAAEASLSGSAGFGQDRDSPFRKSLELYRELILVYGNLCADLGIASASGAVQVSDVSVKDDITDIAVPYAEAPVPPLVVLSEGSGTVTITEFILEWETAEFGDFYLFALYHLTGGSGVRQAWNHGGSLYAGINDDATLLATFTLRTIRSCKITGVDKSVVNRFVIVCQSRAGKASYSNELVIAAS